VSRTQTDLKFDNQEDGAHIQAYNNYQVLAIQRASSVQVEKRKLASRYLIDLFRGTNPGRQCCSFNPGFRLALGKCLCFFVTSEPKSKSLSIACKETRHIAESEASQIGFEVTTAIHNSIDPAEQVIR